MTTISTSKTWPLVLLFVAWGCASLPPKQQIQKAQQEYQEDQSPKQLHKIWRFAQGKDIPEEEGKGTPQEQKREVRQQAMATLAAIPGKKTCSYLVELTQDPDGQIAHKAFGHIQKRGAESCAPQLIQAHKSAPTQIFVTTLATLGDAPSIDYLQTLLDDLRWQEAALKAIARINGDKAQALFYQLSLSDKKDHYLRAQGLMLLSLQYLDKLGPDGKKQPDHFFQRFVQNENLSPILERAVSKRLQSLEKEHAQAIIDKNYKLDKEKGLVKGEGYWVKLYQAVTGLSTREARDELIGPRKKVPQKTIPLSQYKKRRSYILQKLGRLHNSLSLGARHLGVGWGRDKTRVLRQRLRRGLGQMVQHQDNAFQQVYRLLHRRYPRKSFYEIKELFIEEKQMAQILTEIVHSAVHRYSNKSYAVAYVKGLLGLTQQQALVLVTPFY